MSKKMILVALLFMVVSFMGSAMASNSDESVIIELKVSDIDPNETDIPIPRIPAANVYIEIEGNIISFAPFDIQCVMEIVDSTNESIVYETEIDGSDTNCLIPSLDEGTYIVRIVYENFVCWGFWEKRHL